MLPIVAVQWLEINLVILLSWIRNHQILGIRIRIRSMWIHITSCEVYKSFLGKFQVAHLEAFSIAVLTNAFSSSGFKQFAILFFTAR